MNKKQLFDNFAARSGAVAIETDEPEVIMPVVSETYGRFFSLWMKQTKKTDVPENAAKVMYWDGLKGLREINPNSLEEQTPIKDTSTFQGAVKYILDVLSNEDFEDHGRLFMIGHSKFLWNANPAYGLAFEDLLKNMNYFYQGPARIMLVGVTGELPPMVSNMVTSMEMPYPTVEDIRNLLSSTLGKKPDEVPVALIDAMRGLSHRQAAEAARLAGTHRSDPLSAMGDIVAKKIEMLKATAPFVKFMPVVEDPPPLIGIDGLIDYVQRLKAVVDHPELGVSPGGGLMLLGEPGTGKSSFVKYLSHLMKLPVMVFSFADIMGSLVGESEGRMKKVIRATDAIGPVIVQMDEIEKQLPSMKGQASDGGLGTRLVGMILPWMQDVFDENRPVIFVATSNMTAIHNLPPEFLSRFMTFVIDEPDKNDLAAIFTAHLSRISDETYDTGELADALVKNANGRKPVGRDVVQIIRTSQANAVASRQVNVPDMDDLMTAIRDMRVGMRELETSDGRKIFAKPVKNKPVEKAKPVRTSSRSRLPNAGLPDFSSN
jgi:energy-coupling factor transporter ATP-binding protein EcfA2